MKCSPQFLTRSLAAALLCCSAAGIQASTPAQFNPDGLGNDAKTILGLDWTPGGTIISTQDGVGDAVPIGPDPRALQFFQHAELTSALDDNGFVYFTGLGTTYEVTVTFGAPVIVTPQSAANVTFKIDCPDQFCTGKNDFFQIYYDPTPDADPITGEGYNDGQVILTGFLTDVTGAFTITEDPTADILAGALHDAVGGVQALDQFGTDNYPTKHTLVGNGGQTAAVYVLTADPAFFPSGIENGTILTFTNEEKLPYKQNNPAAKYTVSDNQATLLYVANIATINGLDQGDLILQSDASNNFDFLPPAQSCRFTGGGENTAGITYDAQGNKLPGWDGSTAEGGIPVTYKQVTVTKGKKTTTKLVPEGGYVYTFGGQAGANTAGDGQIDSDVIAKGEWEHNNHEGPGNLQFAFHVGTASSGPGTEIDAIRCTDPGNCLNARPAGYKQLNFEGIGEFSNFSIDSGFDGDGMWTFPGIKDVVPQSGNTDCKPGNGPNSCANNPPAPGTYHFVEVHVEDLGEPGNWSQNGQDDAQNCPIDPAPLPNGANGSGDAGNVNGNNPFAEIFGGVNLTTEVANCNCADFYRITIFKGFVPQFNEDGEVTNANKTDKIYEVWGYLEHGNFQIHPPTGFDLK